MTNNGDRNLSKYLCLIAASSSIVGSLAFVLWRRRRNEYESRISSLQENVLRITRDSSMFTSKVTETSCAIATTDDKHGLEEFPSCLLYPGEEIVYLRTTHLSEIFGKKETLTPLVRKVDELVSGEGFLNHSSICTQSIWRNVGEKQKVFYRYLRSGLHEKLYWDPATVVPAIVTCGGLCPGINNVVRGITMMLLEYGVPKVWGVRNGFKGIMIDGCWTELTKKSVAQIHSLGGSILRCNRGNDDPKDMVKALMNRKVNMLFVIGGDGSHRGANAIQDEVFRMKYECSVVGIPKTIDNDIPLIDDSFGFGTAVSEAVRAVQAAYVEATGAPKCVGLIKLMGRQAGFVVLYAVCSAAIVDVALLPEMKVSLPRVLEHIKSKLISQDYCVVVVAEGCGATMMEADPTKRDAGGNLKLPDVGPFLKDNIVDYCKRNGIPDVTVKYIDPTYMIRAVPANAYDSVYCHVLAQNAVHGAMAGYTGFSCAKVDQRYVMLPFNFLVNKPPRQVGIGGRWYARMVMFTEQPSFQPIGRLRRGSSGTQSRDQLGTS